MLGGSARLTSWSRQYPVRYLVVDTAVFAHDILGRASYGVVLWIVGIDEAGMRSMRAPGGRLGVSMVQGAWAKPRDGAFGVSRLNFTI